jgi:hypothetical protein
MDRLPLLEAFSATQTSKEQMGGKAKMLTRSCDRRTLVIQETRMIVRDLIGMILRVCRIVEVNPHYKIVRLNNYIQICHEIWVCGYPSKVLPKSNVSIEIIAPPM